MAVFFLSARERRALLKTITSNNGFEIVVDDEDYEKLSGFNWHYHAKNNFVSCGGVTIGHMILRTDKWVDHADRNGLNNQRSNLRECTASQNAQNKRKPRWRMGSSKFKGVSFHSRNKSWRARITLQDIFGQNFNRSLGCFSTEEEAAEAYDEAARRYFGEFAALNLPKEGERSCLV